MKGNITETKTIQEQVVELELKERQLAIEAAERQALWDVKEREYIEGEWKRQIKRDEQEIARRGIEACVSVIRTVDSGTDIKHEANKKAIELIKRLG